MQPSAPLRHWQDNVFDAAEKVLGVGVVQEVKSLHLRLAMFANDIQLSVTECAVEIRASKVNASPAERCSIGYCVLPTGRHRGCAREGALLHGLRHTFVICTGQRRCQRVRLILLGHESMTTSQRYISDAGPDTRDAAATSGLYKLLE